MEDRKRALLPAAIDAQLNEKAPFPAARILPTGPFGRGAHWASWSGGRPHSVGLHRSAKNAKIDDGIALVDVGNHVRQAAED